MKNLFLYENMKPSIKTGDLIEWKSRSILGWIIRRFSPLSHTSMVCCLSQYRDNTEMRRYVIEAEANGVEPNLLSVDLSRFNGEAYWLPLKSKFDSYREYMGELAQDFIGVKYDYSGLFRNVFGHVSAEADKLFCSEMAFLIYQKAIPMEKFPREAMDLYMADAPRPGEWKQFNIHEAPIRIL